MNRYRVVRGLASLMFVLVIGSYCAPVNAQDTYLVETLADLRNIGDFVDNSTVTLSPNHGDPHPITGVVTPGQYWINGDFIADPANSEPIFMDLNGTGNTYNLSGATINLDTRKLDGFGRNLGHGSSVRVIKISGSDNLVQGINLIGQDIAMDTDPNAQRYADWSARYVDLNGDDNTVDGAHVVTRGSRTDSYGLGDAFGKGSSGGVTPFLAHRKASAFRVGEATNAVINDMHLEVNSFGHGFFVQTSTDTTLTNSTVTGELFSSQGVIDHPLYQQYGTTFHQNEIPLKMISGAEGGVRMYTGSSGLTVDNVVVTNMRTGFSTSLGGGTKTLNNVQAYGTESAFGLGSNTTITNAKADGVNGPIIGIDRNIRSNSSIDVELVGDQPFNHDYALAYVNGNNIDVSITSDRPAEDFDNVSVFRAAQFYYDNWRETNDTTVFDVPGYDHINSVLINDTNARLILGEQAEGNVGRSQGPVVTNGKNNAYDGPSLVPTGKRTVLVHTSGLGNSGTADDGTLETNASVVELGATLEIQPGLSFTDEKLTITGDGVDGNGALFSDGSTENNTRFGSSNASDESTIFLDGDASIGVGIAGNQLLVGRIQGTGDLTKRGAGNLTIGKSSTYDGDLIVDEGHVTARPGVVHNNLTVAAGASISAIGNGAFGTPDGIIQLDGTLDLNGRSDGSSLGSTIGLLNGSGQITSSNSDSASSGALDIAGDDSDGVFDGDIDGDVSLVKSGDNNQTLGGFLTHSGTTTILGGGIYVDGSHAGGGDYNVLDGTLGGEGAIQADITVEDGATVAPGSASSGSTGTLDVVGDYSQAAGSTLAVEMQDASNYDQLNVVGSASLAGVFDLTSSTPGQLNIGDTVTLVDSTEDLSGKFDLINGVAVGDVDGFSAGLAVQYESKSVTATVAILGDANLDGDVDVSQFNSATFSNDGDASILLANLGTTVSALWTDGDFNGDGDVDVSQFDPVTFTNVGDASLLLANLGRSVSSSAVAASSVPEPCSAVALLGLGMSLIFKRRRSH